MFLVMFLIYVCYVGMVIVYNVLMLLFGGIVLIVNDWLIGKIGNVLIFVYYMMVVCVVGLIVLLVVIEMCGCLLCGDMFFG